MALANYNQIISEGGTQAEAIADTTQFLELVGLTPDAASQLLDMIDDGTFQADDSIKAVLQEIAGTGTPSSPSASAGSSNTSG